MDWNYWVRRSHRAIAACFTIGVIINTVVIFTLRPEPPPSWVYLLALLPLFALLFSGLYLFVMRYARSWRAGRPAGGRA